VIRNHGLEGGRVAFKFGEGIFMDAFPLDAFQIVASFTKHTCIVKTGQTSLFDSSSRVLK
jgi:hypothetical protein